MGDTEHNFDPNDYTDADLTALLATVRAMAAELRERALDFESIALAVGTANMDGSHLGRLIERRKQEVLDAFAGLGVACAVTHMCVLQVRANVIRGPMKPTSVENENGSDGPPTRDNQ
jgi:hypothetical protein